MPLQRAVSSQIYSNYAALVVCSCDANMPAAKETFDKLTKIGEGAALMTGTTMEYRIDAAAWPQLSLKSIADTLQANINAVGMPQWSDEEQRFARQFQNAMGAKSIGLNTSVTPLGRSRRSRRRTTKVT